MSYHPDDAIGEVYDIIAPWRNMTGPFFKEKFRKGCPISSAKCQRSPPNGSGPIAQKKTLRGRGESASTPPAGAKVEVS